MRKAWKRGFSFFLLVFSLFLGVMSGTIQEKEFPKKSEGVIKEIYNEVIELKREENQEFIKREFHIELDKNKKNKEEHVLVLIYQVMSRDRIVLQVTYFKPNKRNHIIKNIKEIKKILCYKKEDKIKIEETDYPKERLHSLLGDILKGIREEKRLLKLLDEKHYKKFTWFLWNKEALGFELPFIIFFIG